MPSRAQIETYNAVLCGYGTDHGCKKGVPDGRCHILLDYPYSGHHVLFCEGCCPCGTGAAGLHGKTLLYKKKKTA